MYTRETPARNGITGNAYTGMPARKSIPENAYQEMHHRKCLPANAYLKMLTRKCITEKALPRRYCSYVAIPRGVQVHKCT
jgi:hypothetical protein